MSVCVSVCREGSAFRNHFFRNPKMPMDARISEITERRLLEVNIKKMGGYEVNLIIICGNQY